MNTEVLEQPKAMFGAIQLKDLSGNAELTKLVLPLVKRACAFSAGRFTVDAIVDGMISGQYHLWGAMTPPVDLQAVAVTHIHGQTFEVLLIGGPHINELLAFMPSFEIMAKAVNCTKLTIAGPKTWDRLLPEGWKAAVTIYEHDLA